MPRNKNPEETVQKILDVSLKLFLEKGFEQTTILDIVNNLGGLTRGAFYHHFKSKEEVLEAITDRMFYERASYQKVKEANGLNGLERLKLLLKIDLANNGLLSDEEGIVDLLKVSLSLLSNPRFLAEQIKFNQKMSKLLESFLIEGMEDGSIKPGNPKLLAELILLLGNFWMTPTLFPCTQKDIMDKLTIVKQTFDGLGCPIIDEEFFQIYGKMADKLAEFFED
ncbi:MAG: TetR/AcrR family transcriptional regulator [Defluviitaleaceae bacterium]|nr:TetR/AcrR family transcriptional regulator [Defluviitaleaceae bacterium]